MSHTDEAIRLLKQSIRTDLIDELKKEMREDIQNNFHVQRTGNEAWISLGKKYTVQIVVVIPEDEEPTIINNDSQVKAFTKAILHGDEKHQAWLLEAAEKFERGEAIDREPPVAG